MGTEALSVWNVHKLISLLQKERLKVPKDTFRKNRCSTCTQACISYEFFLPYARTTSQGFPLNKTFSPKSSALIPVVNILTI